MYKIIKQNLLKPYGNCIGIKRFFSSGSHSLLPCTICTTNVQCIESAHCKSKSKLDNDSSVGEIGVGFDSSGSFDIGIQSPIPGVNVFNFNDDDIKKKNIYIRSIDNDMDDDDSDDDGL